jgi:hypothetical protein
MVSEQPINHFCAIFGHDYKLVEKIDKNTLKLECKSCNNHFITHKNGDLLNISANKTSTSFKSYFKRKKAFSRLNQFIGFE